MIDTKELRRLAQAATPHVGHACKYQDAHWLREGHVDFENADLFIASERPQEDAAFYAASNPATVIELLDRLEAAEKSDAESIAMYRKARDERDELRAKIEAMERQEPFDANSDVFRGAFEAALKAGNWPMTRQGDGYRSPSTQIAWRIAFSTVNRLKLYLAPGAQPEPSIPEGWKPVPIEVIYLYSIMCAAFVPMTPQQKEIALQLDLAKRAMLAATPEAKP